jgi:hypothetical protein
MNGWMVGWIHTYIHTYLQAKRTMFCRASEVGLFMMGIVEN